MARRTAEERCIEVSIGGMTCASCELLLERRLKVLPGVTAVDVDHRKGVACISSKGKAPSMAGITNVIEKAGYSVQEGAAPGKQKWMEIGAALLFLFAGYTLLQVFDLLSLAPSTSDALSLGGIFLIGLVAGTSSCLAVTGGLLLALAAKQTAMRQAKTVQEKFRPLLHFNIGRLASYYVLGGLIGVLGQSVTFSPVMSGYLNILVALLMLFMACSMLGIFAKGSLPIRPPKKLSRWIAELSENEHPAAPFALGALSFFLPCGFTQSLQLVALASGSFFAGSSIMLVFALGTLPALIGISAISSSVTGKASHMFLRFSGTFVFVLALVNLQSGLALAGIGPVSVPEQANTLPVPSNAGVQEVSIKVFPDSYSPRNLTIHAGVPVRWKIDGSQALGCTSVMTIPSLNISQPLHAGENILEFTAPQPGQLAFMCSMGMVRGSFTVI